jgi:hypothetical protein
MPALRQNSGCSISLPLLECVVILSCPWAKATLETCRAMRVFVVEHASMIMDDEKKRLMVLD